MITHSITPQCHIILGQIPQGKITKGKVSPGVKLLSILHQCWTILQRKKYQGKTTQVKYPSWKYSV